jgi:hypothetical protein
MFLKGQWDFDGDGTISWEESIPKFLELFQQMNSDGEDHWLGLVDRESSKLFWYNLRDGVTQWMSEEDQTAYQAGFRTRPKNDTLPTLKAFLYDAFRAYDKDKSGTLEAAEITLLINDALRHMGQGRQVSQQ